MFIAANIFPDAHMLPQDSTRYSYNFQAYWMEYEYELKEHGFSSEEDYILKLTDMPFEEMFQISKEQSAVN